MAVIKTNGNREITGALLQNTLVSIVNSLGGNATFAGVATPETSPGTFDGPVFYIASEAGTYPNFSGHEVATNELAIFTNTDTGWDKASIDICTSAYADATYATKESLTSGELKPAHALLADKANNVDASGIIGVLSASQLPAGAITKCVIVTSDTARFLLTTRDVNIGDTVKVLSTNILYLVTDTDHLDSEAGYVEYSAGRASVAEEAERLSKPITLRVGNSVYVFDGSSAIDIAISPSAIGAATTSAVNTAINEEANMRQSRDTALQLNINKVSSDLSETKANLGNLESRTLNAIGARNTDYISTSVTPFDNNFQTVSAEANIVQIAKAGPTNDGLVGAVDAQQYIATQILSKQDKLSSGSNIKTINGESILGSGDIKVVTEGASKEYVDNAVNTEKETRQSVDTEILQMFSAINILLDGHQDQIDEKQNILVSGSNIKTINGKSILGSGDMEIDIDKSDLATKQELSDTANNLGQGISSVGTVAGKALRIAQGANQSVAYNNYQELIMFLAQGAAAWETYYGTAAKVGQNIYIGTLNVPDVWISKLNNSGRDYQYVSDEQTATDLNSESGLVTSWCVLRALETQKVDLAMYVTQTQLGNTASQLGASIGSVGSVANQALTKANKAIVGIKGGDVYEATIDPTNVAVMPYAPLGGIALGDNVNPEPVDANGQVNIPLVTSQAPGLVQVDNRFFTAMGGYLVPESPQPGGDGIVTGRDMGYSVYHGIKETSSSTSYALTDTEKTAAQAWLGVPQEWIGTQAEYDALTSFDENTKYYIV